MLEAGKEVVFNPEDDDFEHQLDLRMVGAPSSSVCVFRTIVSCHKNDLWTRNSLFFRFKKLVE